MSNYKYINPFTDFGFKKIFGEEANKDLLMSFLNELLAYENQEIKELTFKKNEQLPEYEKERKAVYDLFCENEKGEKFIVEMQQAKQEFFKDRMIFYSTFPIKEQAPKGKITDENGKEINWDYELKAVYVIAVLNFKIPVEGLENGKLLSRSKILDVETHNTFYNKLTFITLELPYFNKTIDELENNFDKWIYVLKNLDTFDRIPDKIKDKIFQKLFTVAEYSKLNSDEQLAYELSLSYYRDLYSMIKTAKKDAQKEEQDKYEELLEQAKQQAEQERREKEQAKQQAEQERKEKEQTKIKLLESARLLKNAGVDINQIIQTTGLSKDEIENL